MSRAAELATGDQAPSSEYADHDRRKVIFARPELAAAWGFPSTVATTIETRTDAWEASPELANAVDTNGNATATATGAGAADTGPSATVPMGARAGRVAGLPLLGYYLPALKGNVWATVSVVLAGLAVVAGLVVHQVLLAVACGLLGSVAGGVGQALLTRDRHRAGNLSIAVGLGISLAVTLVGATILGILFAGPADAPPSPVTPPSAAPPSPDSSVVQTRCSGIDGIGYFAGSFTNRTTETVSYRVDVDFLGRDGAPVGQQSTRVPFIGPRATSPLNVSTAVDGAVTVCRTTVTRLPRGG